MNKLYNIGEPVPWDEVVSLEELGYKVERVMRNAPETPSIVRGYIVRHRVVALPEILTFVKGANPNA
jgi:hypothetical protein